MKLHLITMGALLSTSLATAQIKITVDKSKQSQTIEGFGAMAENLPNWGNFKDFTPEYVNTFVDDLGCTIFRLAIDGSMETVNDNSDANSLNTSAVRLGGAPGGCLGDYHIPLSYQIKNLKLLKAKIESNGDSPFFFTTVFSPPAWMKYVNCVWGADANWNRLATDEEELAKGGTNGADGKGGPKDFKNEFAEFCYAYLKTMKDGGVDIHGFSIQNEIAFPQTFSSCVYSPESYLATFKTVGQYLKERNYTPRMVFTEDIGDIGRYNSFVRPITRDAIASQFADIAAIHSYAANAQSPASSDASTWRSLDLISRQMNPKRSFWQTETSGYPDTYAGGMSMATAIFTALKYGKCNAWIFLGMTRPVREAGSEHESLVLVNGQKSVRYHAAKHFYRYIRPGAVQVSTVNSSEEIMSIAFQHDVTKKLTMVLINPSESSKTVTIESLQTPGFPTTFQKYLTTDNVNQKVANDGVVSATAPITLPANSILTLVGENSQPEAPLANEEATASTSMEIYPNPSTDGFTVKFNDTRSGNARIDVLSPDGKMIKLIELYSNESEKYVSTADLTSGMYYLKYENHYMKVVVQK